VQYILIRQNDNYARLCRLLLVLMLLMVSGRISSLSSSSSSSSSFLFFPLPVSALLKSTAATAGDFESLERLEVGDSTRRDSTVVHFLNKPPHSQLHQSEEHCAAKVCFNQMSFKCTCTCQQYSRLKEQRGRERDMNKTSAAAAAAGAEMV